MLLNRARRFIHSKLPLAILTAAALAFLVRTLVGTLDVVLFGASVLFCGWFSAAASRAIAISLRARFNLTYRVGTALTLLVIVVIMLAATSDVIFLGVPDAAHQISVLAYEIDSWAYATDAPRSLEGIDSPQDIIREIWVNYGSDAMLSLSSDVSDSLPFLLGLIVVWLPRVFLVVFSLLVGWRWVSEWLERLLPTWQSQAPYSYSALQASYLRWMAGITAVAFAYTTVTATVLVIANTPGALFLASVAGGFAVTPYVGRIFAVGITMSALAFLTETGVPIVIALGGLMLVLSLGMAAVNRPERRKPTGTGLPVLVLASTVIALALTPMFMLPLAFLVIPFAGFAYFVGVGLASRIDTRNTTVATALPEPD